MKAVMPSLLPDVQAMRKKIGADQWDEMWEGVDFPTNSGHLVKSV